jgi:hypothetical protein
VLGHRMSYQQQKSHPAILRSRPTSVPDPP